MNEDFRAKSHPPTASDVLNTITIYHLIAELTVDEAKIARAYTEMIMKHTDADLQEMAERIRRG